MTSQINVRFSDDFLHNMKSYAEIHGYLNIQEFIREVVRERIYSDISPAYLKRVNNKQATTFLSKKESKSLYEELKKKVRM